MKKLMFFLVLVFPFIFFVSCGSDNDKENGDSDIAVESDSDEISDEDLSETDTDDTEIPDGDDTAAENDEPEKTAEGCYIFTVDESTFGSVYRNTYYGDIKDNILGDKTERDVFGIDLFQTFDGTAIAGTYDLSAGTNKSYLDCTECVRVWQDHDNKDKVKIFFQENGSLVIEEVDYENEIRGTLSASLSKSQSIPTREKLLR